jgi:Rha family phage regulatory protein
VNELEQKYLNSREVAEMVGKDHSDLLKDIRRYTEYLNEGNFPLVEYFKEDTYKDAKGETRNCYMISKKGCEFIAHKMTGQKGAIFTAKYIERFHEMQDALQKPMTQLEIMQMSINQLVEQERRMNELENRLDMIEAKNQTVPNEYFTIAGFATIRKQKVDIALANLLGRKASKLSREYGYEIGKVSDPRYGTVNTYHVDILNKVM